MRLRHAGLVVLLIATAACGSTSVADSESPATSTTIPKQPERMIVNTRAGTVFEMNSDGTDKERLFSTPGVKEADFPRSAQLWNGDVVAGRWGPDVDATVENIDSGAVLAERVDFWGVSPDGRTFAANRDGSSTVTVTDLPTGKEHALDLSALATNMYLSLDTWSADSLELIIGYRRDLSPGPGTVSFVDVETGTVTKTISLSDMSRVSGLAELFDGRLLVLDASFVNGSNQLPEESTVYAVTDDGKQAKLATFSPALTQLHPDASGRHILLLGFDGAHWLEPDGSNGTLFTTAADESYWWADW